MKYMGSKARHAKELIQAMKDHLGVQYFDATPYRQWIEPFVGGANMIAKVPDDEFLGRIGADINPFVIKMFKELQKGWQPPTEITEDQYQHAKALSKESGIDGELGAWVGFVGVGCSYAGKWFGGFARGVDSKGNPRNYAAESARNLLAQKDAIQSVQFVVADYTQFIHSPLPSLIYCDPPYQDTTKYSSEFNHTGFWEWCDIMVEKGHKVFVSEYNAPDGWISIWQKTTVSSLTKDTGSKKAIEQLFTKGVV